MLIDAMVRRRAVREGAEATLRWAEALPDDEDSFRLQVFQRVASTVAEIDPERAAGWATQHAADAWDLPRRVGVRWVRRDPLAAMAWLATLPAGRGREIGVRETYLIFLRTNRPAALAYVEQATLEPWLDPAVSLYTKAIMSDPVRAPHALAWAARISDATLRDTTIVLIGRVWLVADEAAALAWMETAEISDGMRQKILTLPPRQRKLAAERKQAAAGARPETQPDPWGPSLRED
jgi:GNAT superfamily N-acetyltransferase